MHDGEAACRPPPRLLFEEFKEKVLPFKGLTALVGGLVMLLVAGQGTHAASGGSAARSGEVLVRFWDGPGAAARALARVGGRPLQRVGSFGLQRVQLPEALPVEEALATLRDDPGVRYAEPNYLARKANATPDDPLFSEQWNLAAISATQGWELSTGAAEVVVAVLDTGVDYTHPDLMANLWRNPGEIPGNGLDDDGNGVVDDVHGACFNEGTVTGDPWDDDTADSHGTHLSGIIGAVGNNGTGVAGINWRVRLMAVKFLHGPAGLGDVADAVAGIEYAVEQGARVINCSFVIPESGALTEDLQSLADAVAWAGEQGVLVVSAAGNARLNLDQRHVYPASLRLDNNISVAATTREDRLAVYSNRGQWSVDVAAPGGTHAYDPSGVLSTMGATSNPDHGPYNTLSGTSIAAPHVTGLAALLLAGEPELLPAEIKGRIHNGVDPLPALATATTTGGRLNVHKTLLAGNVAAVFDVSPSRVNPGSQLTVSGVHFGAAAGVVSIDGVALSVSSWTDTTVTAEVLPGTAGGRLSVNGFGPGFPVAINQAPSVDLAASPSVGAVPLTVELSARAQDAEGSISLYEWDLGDGAYRAYEGIGSSLTTTLSTPGEYTMRVRITDEGGLTTEASVRVQVAGGGEESSGGCFLSVLLPDRVTR